MSSIKCSYILLVIFAFATIHGLQPGGPCTTMRSEPGTCVPASTCRTVIQFLNETMPSLPPAVANLVRSMYCGKFNSKVHVCCERKSILPERTLPMVPTAGGPCTTMQSEPGTCVPASTCLTVIELLNNKPSIPPAVADLVRSMRCGYFNSIHHVCCDRKSIAPRLAIVPSGSKKSEAEIQAGYALLQGQNNCGLIDGDRVANGENVALSEFPWMALLIYSSKSFPKFGCGGSLIHVRYVLTAAHCILASNRKLKSVRLGEHDTESTNDCVRIGIPKRTKCAPPMQEIDIEKAIYHKDYNSTITSLINDIGLLRLVSNAVIADNVKPICLPMTQTSRDHSFTDMVISGWGRLGNAAQSTILQKAVVPVKTAKFCQEKFINITITEKQICAGGENNIDTCKGDSGGPLFNIAVFDLSPRYILYGVVSFGHRDCTINYPGAYTRVEKYLDWIASNLI